MCIISNKENAYLSEKIASILKLPHFIVLTQKFSNSEIRVHIKNDLSLYNHVIIVHSMHQDVSDSIMELFHIIDVVKITAKKIILLVPYLAYSRQDSAVNNSSFGLKIIAQMLNTTAVDVVLTCDLHSDEGKNFFQMKLHNICCATIFANALSKSLFKDLGAEGAKIQNSNDVVIISPDRGGMKRAEKLADLLGVKAYYMEKKRNHNDKLSMSFQGIDVKDKSCIIYDDIFDTGKTINLACSILQDRGAASIFYCVTHILANLQNSEVQKILSSFKNIYITDSARSTNCQNINLSFSINILSLSKIIAQHLLSYL